MIKRLLLIVVGSLLMAITSFAQESSTWSAYLFDNINYDLIRVHADGSTEAFPLNVFENEYLGLTDISISHNGRYAAYCKITPPQEMNQMSLHTLVIEEIDNGSILEIPYGGQAGCAVTAFSDDDSMIALSVVHYNAFETIPAGEALWSLRLLNVSDGSVVHELQDTDGIMPAFTTFGDNLPLLANVSQFDNLTVQFTAIPYVGMGGPAHLPAYEWDITVNSVSERHIEYGRTNNDYLEATGELVFPALDESLAAAQPEGPMPLANIVNIMDANGNINTIYQNADWVIVSTTFINNGESIAVMLLPAFQEGQDVYVANTTRLEIIHRDGSIQAVDQVFDGGMWIDNAPEGAFIAYTPNPTGPDYNATQLLIWDGNALNQIGEYLPDYTRGWSPPQLLWVTPFTGSADLPAFTPTI